MTDLCHIRRISIHAPTRGATVHISCDHAVHVFQSTLPRGERLLPKSGGGAAILISIHAPTRGATSLCPGIFSVSPISIHAPTRGATKYSLLSPTLTEHFNPRSHEGSDGTRIVDRRTGRNFNPRSHEGSDDMHAALDYAAKVFQSTLPRGERPKEDLAQERYLTISIHAPTRGATRASVIVSSTVSFQSTLPRGERQKIAGFPGSNWRFQSTLPRGERRSTASGLSGFSSNFNPRSHEGSDAGRGYRAGRCRNFNPRSHEGSDLGISLVQICPTLISIHAPTRGATEPQGIGMSELLISIHAPTRGATGSAPFSRAGV